jgi:signal transduction histidine kinase
MGMRVRTAPILAFVGALALLGAGVWLALYIDRTYEAQRLAQLSAQARILAATATAALDFHDQRAAQEYVDALHANPEIVAAGIYDLTGGLLASFPHQPSATLPSALMATVREPPQVAGMLTVTAPIQVDTKPLGVVLLQSPTEPFSLRLQRYGVISLLLAMAVLLVGILGFSEAALRRRTRELAAVNAGLQQEIAQREQVEAALRQAQKMEAIGQLTGGIAHDFNNLLQVVLGSLERLRLLATRNGTKLEPSLDRMVETAMQGAQRAATLTRRLLAFSRRQALDPKPIAINKLVASMSDLLRRTLGESIEIETVLAAGVWLTLADENQLENVLLNLAVNARDAMPNGGKLTVETSNAHLDEAYVRGETEVKPGQYVLLAITDTGTGMTPEVLAQVFEPFFTTKGVGHGTGLGLSQVYGFIKQSDGHIKIYSEVGQGTTVRIYLPRLVAADTPPVVQEAPPMPRASDGECILVVEDEDSVRALTTETLRDLGYRVLEAGDGPSALRILRAEPAVRLLFTDVGLPGGMNGRQLADSARQLRPDLSVLFTTGYARNAIIHHGRLDPGVELIVKPFSAPDLAARVRMLLGG